MTSITYVDPVHKYDTGRRFTPTAESMRSAERALFVASLIPSVRVGRGIWTVVSGSRAVRGVSVVKRPVHEMLALRASSRPGSPWSSHIIRSLKWRKRAGLAALGVSAINPFQSVRYARKRDWTRLGINIRYPIVGVPIYDLVEGSSSEPSQQNGGPSATSSKKRKGGKGSRRSTPPAAKSSAHGGGGSGAKPRRFTIRRSRPRCPPGYFWSYQRQRCERSLPWAMRKAASERSRMKNGKRR